MEGVETVDREFDFGPVRAGENGRLKQPAGSVAAEADAQVGWRGGLQVEGAHLEEGDVENRVGPELVEGERQAVGQTAADDVDALAIGREDIQAVADLGGIADAEGDGLERNGRALAGGQRAVQTGGERQRKPGFVQPIVGQRKAAFREILDEEAGLVFEEHQFVEHAADGMRIGGPFDGLGEHPALGTLLDAHGFGQAAADDGERLDGGGFGAEHASPALLPDPVRLPLAHEREDEEEEDDVEQQQDERDFGAHGGRDLRRKMENGGGREGTLGFRSGIRILHSH